MNKIAKRATAFACAALVAAGGLVQASASTFTYNGVRFSGTSTRDNSTTVTAKTACLSNVLNGCNVYARAYATVNGSKQYGAGKTEPSDYVNDPVEAPFYVVSGVGLTGYGGQHRIHICVLDPVTGALKYDSSPTYSTDH